MEATNHQINPEAITPVIRLDFKQLDDKYKYAFSVGIALIYLSLMALALLLLLFDNIWIVISAECCLAAAFGINLTIVSKSLRQKGYAFRQHDISYRRGIFFPKVTTVPYVRIQQVSVTQNIVSKIFHLHSVEIVNGAQGMSSICIPGLAEETAIRLRNFITEKLTCKDD